MRPEPSKATPPIAALAPWSAGIARRVHAVPPLVLSQAAPYDVGDRAARGSDGRPYIASIMCAGGVLAYLVLIPAIKYFGAGLMAPLAPATFFALQVASLQPSAVLSQPKWPGPTPFRLSLSWRLRIAGSSKALAIDL